MICKALGGLNERGNHCFLIDYKPCPILLDCGLGGPKNPYPRLTEEITKNAGLLLVSHSHIDHIGSIPYLQSLGFKGKILTSRTTFKTAGSPNGWDCLFIEPGETVEYRGISVTAHRAGHCLGSLWFDIRVEGKSIVYSGDYMEGESYSNDPIRGIEADLAILDGSYYGKEVPDVKESTEKLKDLINRFEGRVIMPAPKNGRGLSLYALLRSFGYSVRIVGDPLQTTDASKWLEDPVGDIVSDPDGVSLLLTDKDFVNPETAKLVLEDKSRAMIFTGNLDPGSVAENLYNSRPNSFRCFYNAHQTQKELDNLLKSNLFKNIWLFSSEKTSYTSLQVEF